jgi:hypothetical protein
MKEKQVKLPGFYCAANAKSFKKGVVGQERALPSQNNSPHTSQWS